MNESSETDLKIDSESQSLFKEFLSKVVEEKLKVVYVDLPSEIHPPEEILEDEV